MKLFYVYILASRTRVLYIGMTSNLERRVREHQSKARPGFTSKYNVNRLVYFEAYNMPQSAITREKQLKGLLREKKIALIEAENPTWEDLSLAWDEQISLRRLSAEV
jgi:putative endonuclease